MTHEVAMKLEDQPQEQHLLCVCPVVLLGPSVCPVLSSFFLPSFRYLRLQKMKSVLWSSHGQEKPCDHTLYTSLPLSLHWRFNIPFMVLLETSCPVRIPRFLRKWSGDACGISLTSSLQLQNFKIPLIGLKTKRITHPAPYL